MWSRPLYHNHPGGFPFVYICCFDVYHDGRDASYILVSLFAGFYTCTCSGLNSLLSPTTATEQHITHHPIGVLPKYALNLSYLPMQLIEQLHLRTPNLDTGWRVLVRLCCIASEGFLLSMSSMAREVGRHGALHMVMVEAWSGRSRWIRKLWYVGVSTCL